VPEHVLRDGRGWHEVTVNEGPATLVLAN